MNFIKTHQKTTIAIVACLILIILAMFAIYRMFYPNSSKSVYGDRTKNAPEIDQAVVERIKDNIENKGLTNSVSEKVNGPIIKFFIDTKKGTSVKDAQDLTIIITDNFSTSILQYYDIEVYITQKEDEIVNEFPMIGYHSKDAEEFTFVLNKVGATDEK